MSDSNSITEQEQAVLRRLAGSMISASEEFKIPGADDEVIFRKMLKNAEDVGLELRAGMEDFFAEFGGIAAIATLDEAGFKELMDIARKKHHSFLEMMMGLVARSYYEDPRVLIALNKEDRPPFPKGSALEQGDWSLLDPVKNRNPFFRDC